MAVIDDVKSELNITGSDKDSLLSMLISSETANAVTITHNPAAGEDDGMIIRMVVFRYNRLGTEGLNSESYSGVNFNYTADYPEDILVLLKAYKKVRVISND